MNYPDSGLYRWVVDLANGSPKLIQTGIEELSTLGILAIFALCAVALFRCRRRPAEATARLIGVPIGVVLAFLAGLSIKLLVQEVRPCHVETVRSTFHACPAATDWSFPSDHMTIAVSAAAGLWLVDRQLGIIAAILAIGVGFSRVWVGVHYPHDVLAGAILGLLFGIAVVLAAGTHTKWVTNLRRSEGGRRLVGPGPKPRRRYDA